MKWALIGAGGLVGAIARYATAGLVQRVAGISFPMGTLAVNLVGCFCIGALMYLTEDRAVLGPDARLFLGVGMLGAFTTFSTFGYETFAMLREGSFQGALLNAAGSVVVGLAAVWLGHEAARTIWS